jgi:hypothetical protein
MYGAIFFKFFSNFFNFFLGHDGEEKIRIFFSFSSEKICEATLHVEKMSGRFLFYFGENCGGVEKIEFFNLR